ncbi:hypothetical protein RCL_jg22528.t1 [Rhizophagus clarus]|nr:hypothetical protein RCL_jg22528.t1 [Rhizophagus clarus]
MVLELVYEFRADWIMKWFQKCFWIIWVMSRSVLGWFDSLTNMINNNSKLPKDVPDWSEEKRRQREERRIEKGEQRRKEKNE